VIPPALSAAFVAAMEDVLTVYARRIGLPRSLVCFDESGKAVHAHRIEPQPGGPGVPAREDTTP
jgi:hypothetical protein